MDAGVDPDVERVRGDGDAAGQHGGGGLGSEER